MADVNCTHCDEVNPVANRYCGQCGEPMRRKDFLTQADPAIVGDLLENIDVSKVGRTVAMSAAALAAEVAIIYLRRRLRQQDSDLNQPATRRLRNAGLGVLTSVALIYTERHKVSSENGRPVRSFLENKLLRKDDNQV